VARVWFAIIDIWLKKKNLNHFVLSTFNGDCFLESVVSCSNHKQRKKTKSILLKGQFIRMHAKKTVQLQSAFVQVKGVLFCVWDSCAVVIN